MKKLTNKILSKTRKYIRRKVRTNTMAKELSDLPRLIVNKTNQFTYAQIVDLEGHVLASANDMKIKEGTKTQRAENVGKEVAKKALDKGVEKICFDRNGNLYTGRIKALAEGARAAGLQF